MEEDVQLGLVAATGAQLAVGAAQLAVTPPMVVAQVARPTADDYQRADAIVDMIPDTRCASWCVAATASCRCCSACCSTTTSRVLAAAARGDRRARLGLAMATNAGRTARRSTCVALHPSVRLPLASLAFPRAAPAPAAELDVFLDTVHAVVPQPTAACRCSNIAWAACCRCRCASRSIRRGTCASGARSCRAVRSEVCDVVVRRRAERPRQPEAAQRAYLTGIQRVLPQDHLPYLPRKEGALALDPAWGPLDALDPLAKQAVIEGLVATISHDNAVTVSEAELLRAICAGLHCPLPPMLER
jgi:hypothetical protein